MDEEYGITLDEKFTDVPFFLLTVKNEEASTFEVWLKKLTGFDSNFPFFQILSLFGVLLGLYCLFKKYKAKRQGYQNVIESAREEY